MKKAFLVIILLLAIGVGGYYALHSLNGTAHGLTAEELVPAETPVFLTIPDVPASKIRWEQTALAKLAAEPQIKAFLEKPLGDLKTNHGFSETCSMLQKLEAKSAFLALVALEENEPKLAGGFRFNGDENALNTALEPVRKRIQEKYPTGISDIEDYEGVRIESFRTNDFFVAFAKVGEWFLWANQDVLLKQTLDRLQKRDTSPALNASQTYQALLKKLPTTVESTVIIQPQLFIERIITALSAGGSLDAKQTEALRKLKGIVAATSFEGSEIRDTVYFLADVSSLNKEKLSFSASNLTTADTLFFLTSRIHLSDQDAKLPEGSLDTVQGGAVLKNILERLEQEGIDLKTFSNTFGSEFSSVLNWQDKSMQPTLTFALDVKDRATAEKMVKTLISDFGSELDIAHTQADHADFYELQLGGFIPVSPTLALTADRIYLSSDKASLQTAIQNTKAADGALLQSTTYNEMAKKVNSPTESYLYLDTQRFVTRLYNSVRPLLGFVSASANIDVHKLPDTETITKYLSPAVLSVSVDDDGLLVSSVGPITFNQAAVLGLSGAVMNQLKNQSQQH